VCQSSPPNGHASRFSKADEVLGLGNPFDDHDWIPTGEPTPEAFEIERAARGKNVTETETETEPPKRGCGSFASDSGQVQGDEYYEGVLDVVNATPPPSIDVPLHAKYARLVHVCFVMQCMRGDMPFFLDVRRAARLVGSGISHMTAWRWLEILCQCGVLELVERGSELRSNRYRFVTRVRNVPGGRHAG